MNLITIFALLSLAVTVRGAWWAAAAQPVILGLGAVMGALNLDIFDAQPIKWDFYMPSFNPSSRWKTSASVSDEESKLSEKEQEQEQKEKEKADAFKP